MHGQELPIQQPNYPTVEISSVHIKVLRLYLLHAYTSLTKTHTGQKAKYLGTMFLEAIRLARTEPFGFSRRAPEPSRLAR